MGTGGPGSLWPSTKTKNPNRFINLTKMVEFKARNAKLYVPKQGLQDLLEDATGVISVVGIDEPCTDERQIRQTVEGIKEALASGSVDSFLYATGHPRLRSLEAPYDEDDIVPSLTESRKSILTSITRHSNAIRSERGAPRVDEGIMDPRRSDAFYSLGHMQTITVAAYLRHYVTVSRHDDDYVFSLGDAQDILLLGAVDKDGLHMRHAYRDNEKLNEYVTAQCHVPNVSSAAQLFRALAIARTTSTIPQGQNDLAAHLTTYVPTSITQNGRTTD